MIYRRCFLAVFGVSTLNAFQAKKQPPPKTESLMSRILRLTGISATPRGLKGLGNFATGDIWKVAADRNNKTQEKLTFDGGYRSPVFTPDDQKVLAIRGSNLVWISMRDSSTIPAEHTLPDLVRLIGFETGRQEKPRLV